MINNESGEETALEYLKQWHDYGMHEGSEELSHGTYDYTYEKDNYIMSYNIALSYVFRA